MFNINSKILITVLALTCLLPLTLHAEEATNKVSSTAAAAQFDQQIHINTASAAELQLLKGIGKAKAKSIVAYRESHGQFHDIKELQQVKGIGEKLIANNTDKLAL